MRLIFLPESEVIFKLERLIKAILLVLHGDLRGGRQQYKLVLLASRRRHGIHDFDAVDVALFVEHVKELLDVADLVVVSLLRHITQDGRAQWRRRTHGTG